MKELLLKRKFRLFMYVLACFIPVFNDFFNYTVLALVFEAVSRQDMAFFMNVVLIAISFIIITPLLFLGSRMLRIKFMREILLDVRRNAFDKVINSTFKNFNKKSKDTYISNLVNDINTFESTFFLNLINSIYHGGVYIISFIVLLFMDFYFALILIALSIIMFFISKRFESKTVDLQKKVSSENEAFTIEMANTFNGLEILKLNNIETKYLLKSKNSIDNLEKRKFFFNFYSESQRSFSSTMAFVLGIGGLVYLIPQFNEGISLFQITLMVQLTNNVVFSLTNFLPRLNVLISSKSLYDKITKNDDDDNLKTNLNKTNIFSYNNEITVKDLKFNYDGKRIFNGASFKIEKGKKYLIKGPSGVGKSTLIKLLSMTYDHYEGEILIDNVSIKEINENSFNNHIAFIYQDVFLFEDTIANNISLFKKINENKIMEAIKRAGLTEFINDKANGLNEMLNENGKNLSGGERQRISIARAIVKEAEILFIDEGTSALNEELGKEIENTFLSLDNTVIAISHRYYKGVTDKFDYVLEIKDGIINTYKASEYFEGELYA